MSEIPGPLCGESNPPTCSTPGPTGFHDVADIDQMVCSIDTPGPTADLPEIPYVEHSGGMSAASLIQTYDSNLRVQYADQAKKLAQQVADDFEAGRFANHLDARAQAHAGRNQLLDTTREKLSPGGKALSEAIKEEGKSLPQLVEHYARKRLEADPALMKRYGLTTIDPKAAGFNQASYRQAIKAMAETEEITSDILASAGRVNKPITAVARVSRWAGPAGHAIGIFSSAYEVAQAPEDEKMYVAGREASGFAGGVVGSVGGGLAAGWVASLACGPGAAVCALAVSVIIVGGASYGGGWLGEKGFEKAAGGPK